MRNIADNLVQNRNLDNLKKGFRERFVMAMDDYNRLYEPNIFPVETLRTKELQAYYVSTGASKTLKSNHLTGNACDIGFAGPELYPADYAPRGKLCMVMRRYGIVNAYYDLKRGFDKPHFQAVEIQAPIKYSPTYSVAKNWKEKIHGMMKIRSASRHKANPNRKRKFHERNEKMRRLFDSIGEKY